MPRRALRCIVDLELHAVSAPGVWLPSREDVYISVSLFNQYRNTRMVTSCFPIILNEKFRFEKTYYTAMDPGQVADMLEDELVIFELVQLSEYTDGAVRLASYSTNCRDFLYPLSTLAPSYSAHDREILMCRTIAFPGISPKMEFSSKTIIRESISPELDALDDALARKREVASLRKTQRCPSSRNRSPSPVARRKLVDIDLDSTIDPRPPFVVRKLECDLIGRKPGGENDKYARSRPKTSARSVSPMRRRSFSGGDDLNISYNATPRNHLSTVLRYPYRDPMPVYKSRYSTLDDEIDREVAELTKKRVSNITKIRPRSVSPLLYRRTLKERFDDLALERSYTPTYYERALAREREVARLTRLNRLYDYPYYSTMDDLELDLRLARIRAQRY